MAILKKGSRKIVVEEIKYRWNMRRKPTHAQADYSCSVSAAVELLENPGSVLHITFTGNNYNYDHGTEFPVTPKDVEASIKSALNKGWQPEKSGATFEFSY